MKVGARHGRTVAVLVPTPAHYETERNRAIRDARHAVRHAILKLQRDTDSTLRAAVTVFLSQAATGRLGAAVAAATLSLACDGRGRKGQGVLPSARTLFRWIAADNLLPKTRKADLSVKPWMPAAVALRARPQRPTTQSVHDALLESWDMAWGEPISYRTLARFFRDKLRRIDLLKGTTPRP